ncbi:MAG: AraC family transcriptional regulator [Verrucomicrobiota bacterium]
MHHLSYLDWPNTHDCTYVAWEYKRPIETNLHSQDYYELFWVENGKGLHRINNEVRLLETGYFVLIHPNDIHSFSSYDKRSHVQFINFAFRPEVWDQLRRVFFANSPDPFEPVSIRQREFQISQSGRERLRLMAADLAAGQWTKLNASAFLLGTLALLTSLGYRSRNPQQAPHWLTQASHLIEQYPQFQEGVPQFVRLAGRSHEHVSRACRKWLKTTPRNLVNKARLKWAGMQMSTTQKSIIEIAHECGFDNLGHFYKLFNATYGMTPRNYRRHFEVQNQE